MTVRLASGNPQTLHAPTIGAAWLAVARRIMADGVVSRYDGLPVREIPHVTLAVERPDPDDKPDIERVQPGAGSSPRSAARARRRASFSPRPRACGGSR